MSAPAVIGVCWKVVDLRAVVDPLTGDVLPDPDGFGVSAADEAALEWALRLGEAWERPVLIAAAGERSCEPLLQAALAAGAARAVRVAIGPDSPSALVAAALASAVRAELAAVATEAVPAGVLPVVVCCGDASLDRGSGSVPAFLAGELGAAQALGLVGLGVETADRTLLVERRLDRGRRERLRVRPPFVVSVEAGTARLRRASLSALLATRRAEIEVAEAGGEDRTGAVGGTLEAGEEVEAGRQVDAARIVGIEPFRPRTRVVAPPPATLGPRERVLALTGALRGRQPSRTLKLGPEEAAAALLQALSDWGELP